MPVELSRVSCRPRLLLPIEPSRSRKRAIAEKIQALVGDLEPRRGRVGTEPSAAALRLAVRAIRFQVGRRRDEAFLHHAIDDVLDQLLELRSGVRLIGVGRIAEQTLDRFLGQHPAVEQGVHDGVVQRLHRAVVFRLAVHAAVRRLKAARQQQIRELLNQLVQIQIVERIARVLGVLVTHSTSTVYRSTVYRPTSLPPTTYHLPPSCSTSSSRPAAEIPRRHRALPRAQSGAVAAARPRGSRALRCG